MPWDEFAGVAMKFFDESAGDTVAHDWYFGNFGGIWLDVMETGAFSRGESVWEQALRVATQWEQAHPSQALHKGTGYYFWAMTALLKGVIDRGYLLIHQAVVEDARRSGQPTPDTPAYALVSLNYEKVDQAFRQWVIEQAAFFDGHVENYATTYSRQFTIDDVKRRFLDAPPDIEIVFLLTYTIARLKKLLEMPEHAINNPFAGQLQINLLFDLTLVIDNSIKSRSRSGASFIDHAEDLLDAAGSPLSNDHLRTLMVVLKDTLNTRFGLRRMALSE